MEIEVRIMATLGKHQLGRNRKGSSGELEMVYVLIWVVFSRVNVHMCKNSSYTPKICAIHFYMFALDSIMSLSETFIS